MMSKVRCIDCKHIEKPYISPSSIPSCSTCPIINQIHGHRVLMYPYKPRRCKYFKKEPIWSIILKRKVSFQKIGKKGY